MNAVERALMAERLTQYVIYHGAIHEDDCPSDDTCECRWRPVNNAVNAACDYLKVGRENEMRALASALRKCLPPDLFESMLEACTRTLSEPPA